jgi:hypothetical protein
VGIRSFLFGSRDDSPAQLAEAAPVPARADAERVLPTRAGYEAGIGPEGINDLHTRRGVGAQGNQDRASSMRALFDAFMTCPWSSASINVIARTITAGGLKPEWQSDDDEGDLEVPPWPSQVQALMDFLAYCNPRENIRQIVRGMISDLLIFGETYVEIVWLLGLPVALYSLDATTMYPVADQHGDIHGFIQRTEEGQRAEFEPREVIWITLDSPQSGLEGVSPTEQALLPITMWLFASATLKERFRKGDPPDLAVDHPASMSEPEVRKWSAQYMQRNVGIKNIGMPVTTKGGGSVAELRARQLEYVLKLRDQVRDEIVATYGVPPRKVGIIEQGSLGGQGAETGQDKTFRINTCQPTAELVLEALNFVLLPAFGVEGWQLKFGDVDWRDDKVIEDIRDMRLRSGAWTLNRYRVDVGEPPLDEETHPAANEPLFTDRMTTVLWRDLGTVSANTANPPTPPPAPGQPAGEEDDEPPAKAKRAAERRERIALLAEAVRTHRAATRELDAQAREALNIDAAGALEAARAIGAASR